MLINVPIDRFIRSQFGLIDTIINVPIDLVCVQCALLQYFNDSMIIVVMLKRKLEYKNAYLLGNVGPMIVTLSLHDLCNMPL